MNRNAVICLFVLSFLAIAGHAESRHSVDVQPAWGTAQHVALVDQLYLVSQPDYQGYAEAAQAGVTAVINLRGADEVDWDVADAVSQAGMQYFNEPLIVGEQGLDAVALQRISALVKQLQGEAETVMVHCSSANRAAAWWAVDLVQSQHLEPTVAVNLARQAGLTKPELIQLVEAYLAPVE